MTGTRNFQPCALLISFGRVLSRHYGNPNTIQTHKASGMISGRALNRQRKPIRTPRQRLPQRVLKKGKGTRSQLTRQSQIPRPKAKTNRRERDPKSIQQGGNHPPCIFYARGKCTRANCPFSHDAPATSAAAASTAMPKAPAAQPKAKAVAAMVAYLCGLGPVMGMTTAVESDFSGYLDFIGDTGAGECLGSPEALKKQGLYRCSIFLLHLYFFSHAVCHRWRDPTWFYYCWLLGGRAQTPHQYLHATSVPPCFKHWSALR